MLTDMTKFDHVLRITTGSLIVLLYVTESIAGGVAHLLLVMGLVLVVTSVMKYCFFYQLIENANCENKPSK